MLDIISSVWYHVIVPRGKPHRAPWKLNSSGRAQGKRRWRKAQVAVVRPDNPHDTEVKVLRSESGNAERIG